MRYYILVGTVAAVIAAWSGAWFYLAGQLRGEIEQRASQSTPAREWSYRDLQIGGYPFRMRADLSGPHIVWRGAKREFDWQSERIRAVSHPWQPRHILFDLTGPHLFKAKLRGHWRQLTLDSDEAMASLETNRKDRPERLSLDIKQIRLRYNGAPVLRGARLQLHSRPAPNTADGVDLALRGVALEMPMGILPASFDGAPRTAKVVDLQTTLTGLPEGEWTPDGLARWRDGGGTLEINKLHIQWGDMDISAKGSLALDDRMRPIGALTAHIRGHEQLLDIAATAGTMDKNSLAAARAVLNLLAAAGGGVLSVPVRLQDGKLFLGPAPIARLAAITGD